MNVEDGIKLRELQQIGHLAAGIAQFELTPWLPVSALALWARIPVSLVIFENSGAAFGASRLCDSAERHDQFTETAAVDVRNVFEIQQDLVMALGHLIADGLTQCRKGIAGRDLTREIYDEDGVCPSGGELKVHSAVILCQSGFPRMRIENWELRIGQIDLIQFLRLRAVALALRVSIPNSHPSRRLSASRAPNRESP